jgi:uncharacterized protein with HEPN domain
MYRDVKVYLEDMINSIDKIFEYTDNISFDEFKDNSMIFDAVVRRLEILGEAANQIKKYDINFYQKHSNIEWREIIDFRNILIHGYFGIIEEIVWNVIKNRLKNLQDNLKAIYENSN